MESMKQVIFDFDSTLFDTSAGVIACMADAFAKSGMPIPESEKIRRSIGLPLKEAFGFLCAGKLSRGSIALLEKNFLKSAEAQMVDLTVEIEGATSVLKELRAQGYAIGIVTNKYRDRVVRTLDRFKVLGDIDDLVCGDDGLPNKPSPVGIHKVLQVGIAPALAVFVGDHPIDVQAAHAAGTLSCAVASGNYSLLELQQCEPTWVIERLTQLPAILSQRKLEA